MAASPRSGPPSRGRSRTSPLPLFIDCTGDGHLGRMAGCSFWLGASDGGFIQGQTLIFCAAPVDFDRVAEYALAKGARWRPIASWACDAS